MKKQRPRKQRPARRHQATKPAPAARPLEHADAPGSSRQPQRSAARDARAGNVVSRFLVRLSPSGWLGRLRARFKGER